jgi:hypothetical protein
MTRLVTVLDAVDNHFHFLLKTRACLQVVCVTVASARDHVQLIQFFKRLLDLPIALSRIYNGTYRLSIVNDDAAEMLESHSLWKCSSLPTDARKTLRSGMVVCRLFRSRK